MTRAVFLDRDGVINPEVYYETSGEWEAPMRARDFRLNDGVTEALRLLIRHRYELFVVSNQGAFAKGKVDLASLWGVHERFISVMTEAGIVFRECFYSFAHPDGVIEGFSGPSLERKPGSYFLLLAQAKYGLRLDQSWMVGDRDTDIRCGRAAGVATIRIASPVKAGAVTAVPDFEATDLGAAAEIILTVGRRHPCEAASASDSAANQEARR
jgi:D-glycero-D-manno-heptose 1,7-bisphosphate phosphatase